MVYLSMRYSLFKQLLKSRTHVALHQTEPVPNGIWMISEGKTVPITLNQCPGHLVTNGVSLLQTNKNHSAYWPSCRGHALPPHWLKACNPARNGGGYDHHHRVYHGVVL